MLRKDRLFCLFVWAAARVSGCEFRACVSVWRLILLVCTCMGACVRVCVYLSICLCLYALLVCLVAYMRVYYAYSSLYLSFLYICLFIRLFTRITCLPIDLLLHSAQMLTDLNIHFTFDVLSARTHLILPSSLRSRKSRRQRSRKRIRVNPSDAVRFPALTFSLG